MSSCRVEPVLGEGDGDGLGEGLGDGLGDGDGDGLGDGDTTPVLPPGAAEPSPPQPDRMRMDVMTSALEERSNSRPDFMGLNQPSCDLDRLNEHA
ncbi:hypothetical protein [Erythrobacter sp. THAF29]|uniref:hypothetical protein n=1 Tax=Erythrobacter sp. THAF29 TaxID=2587851 RepID=UPI0012683E2B|nr:hypothetical protein [Erythrobacter sp. THAF29]QFT77881.1 hypothetical protein FIU90_10070 [Erythrobacter sp. THAF29]